MKNERRARNESLGRGYGTVSGGESRVSIMMSLAGPWSYCGSDGLRGDDACASCVPCSAHGARVARVGLQVALKSSAVGKA